MAFLALPPHGSGQCRLPVGKPAIFLDWRAAWSTEAVLEWSCVEKLAHASSPVLTGHPSIASAPSLSLWGGVPQSLLELGFDGSKVKASLRAVSACSLNKTCPWLPPVHLPLPSTAQATPLGTGCFVYLHSCFSPWQDCVPAWSALDHSCTSAYGRRPIPTGEVRLRQWNEHLTAFCLSGVLASVWKRKLEGRGLLHWVEGFHKVPEKAKFRKCLNLVLKNVFKCMHYTHFLWSFWKNPWGG